MMWTIQEVARAAGVTSRTLRHYDAEGILTPSEVAANGYRRYDEVALLRLQRIMLLRDLGLGIPQIRQVLSQETDEVAALESHLLVLREQQDALARRISSVISTINARKDGEELVAEEMFDGFDQHKDEVIRRWGNEAYAQSNAWWTGQSAKERNAWQGQLGQLNASWVNAARSGVDPAAPEAQAIAERHVAWLQGIPGTPAATVGGDLKGYVLGLAEMYVSDPRFAKNYAISEGEASGAEFVREALRIFVARQLG